MADNPFAGGSGTKKSGKKRQPNPKRDTIRALTRALRATGDPMRPAMIARSLQGLTPKQVRRTGEKIGLPADQIDNLVKRARAAHAPEEREGYVSPGLVTALDILDKPVQGTKGAAVGASETLRGQAAPWESATSAWRGVTGKERFGGSQTGIAVLGGKDREEAKKIAESLPGPVRFAGDVVVDTLLDPTNYVTLGAGGLADDAARAAAKITVGQAAKDAVLSPAARDVYENILAKGIKGLTTKQRRVLELSFSKGKIPAELRRKINRAQGGVRFAGKQVPGTRGMFRNVGPKSKGLGSSVERFLRPDAEVKQLGRTVEGGRSAVGDVRNVRAQVEGAEQVAGMSARRAERGFAEALGRGLTNAEYGSRAAIKAGEKALRDDPEILDRVLRTLDVGGGQAARAALPKGEREAAEFLSTLRHEDQVALESVGRIRSDADLAAQHRQLEMFGDDIDLLDPRFEEQYIYHLPENATRRPGGVSPRPGFLKRRHNTGPVTHELDPREAMGVHQAGTRREVAMIEAHKELEQIAPDGKAFAVRGDDVAPGRPHSAKIEQFKIDNPNWEDEYVEMSAPTLEGSGRIREPVLIRKEIAPFYEKFAKAQTDKTFVDSLKYLSALWAGYAVATPGFIMRNVLQGNMMLAWMADGLNPRVWARQLGTMRRMQRGIARLGDPYAFVKAEERAFVEEAIRNNVVGSNFMASLRDQARASAEAAAKGRAGEVMHTLKTSGKSPFSTEFGPVRAVKNANQWAENWSRLSLYATKIRQGYSPPEAAAIARQYMLDYKNLSPANDALRTVSPFMTWTYKVTPLVFREAVTDPRKIRIPQTILNALDEQGAEDQRGPFPEWMAESDAVRIPGTDQAFIPQLPQQTANQTASPLLTELQVLLGQRPGGTGHRKAFLEALNALGLGGPVGGALKSLIEVGTGTQTFTGREMPAGSRVPNPIPFVGGTIPWELQNVISNQVPAATRLATFAPKSDYDKAAQNRRLLSILAGVSLFPNDEAAQRSEWYRRLDEINAWIKSRRDAGKKVPSSSTGGSGKGGNPFGGGSGGGGKSSGNPFG